MPASPFSGPNSSDIRRRGVVVRASSAARLWVSSAITTFFTVACSMVPNGSMRYDGVDDCVEDESESDSREPIGLPGKRPVSQCADEFVVLDVVKTFFDAFWIVRENTTPNTVQTCRPLEGFLSSSVFRFFSSVFMSLRVVRRQSKVSHAAASKPAFCRLLNVGDCLPVGTQVLEQ